MNKISETKVQIRKKYGSMKILKGRRNKARKKKRFNINLKENIKKNFKEKENLKKDLKKELNEIPERNFITKETKHEGIL